MPYLYSIVCLIWWPTSAYVLGHNPSLCTRSVGLQQLFCCMQQDSDFGLLSLPAAPPSNKPVPINQESIPAAAREGLACMWRWHQQGNAQSLISNHLLCMPQILQPTGRSSPCEPVGHLQRFPNLSCVPKMKQVIGVHLPSARSIACKGLPVLLNRCCWRTVSLRLTCLVLLLMYDVC